jgi:hypothetical protein
VKHHNHTSSFEAKDVVDVSRSTSTCRSNPVLSPKILLLFATSELEFHGDDVIEALVERWGAEATGEIAEGDSRQGGSGFGVLVGLLIVGNIRK